MKYTDEYRNGKLVGKLADKINEMLKQYSGEMVLMEVCGTHTMAIFRSGLRKLLAENIRLLSGPGCPVCVTPNYYLDKAIAYARRDEVIITTFGDMMKVPGSSSSLEREKSNRGNIQVVYSALDALEIAQANPAKRVIFLGVGFETTAPTLAATIETAKQKNIGNFLVFSGHKLIPPAMRALVNTKQLHVNGFICPGHVSTIIGSRPYEFIANEYNIPCVVTGFEPLDVVQGIYMLANQIINEKESSVQIQYRRSVREEGNIKALNLMKTIFEVIDSEWRGIGNIPESGLRIRETYQQFDAEARITVEVEETRENKGCICGEILRGIKMPLDCKLFRASCSPENPIGACMVSSEGTCAAYFKYGDK